MTFPYTPMTPDAPVEPDEQITDVIARWETNTGGSERANCQLFLTEPCTLLGLPQREPTHEKRKRVTA